MIEETLPGVSREKGVSRKNSRLSKGYIYDIPGCLGRVEGDGQLILVCAQVVNNGG